MSIGREADGSMPALCDTARSSSLQTMLNDAKFVRTETASLIDARRFATADMLDATMLSCFGD